MRFFCHVNHFPFSFGYLEVTEIQQHNVLCGVIKASLGYDDVRRHQVHVQIQDLLGLDDIHQPW